MFKKKGVEVSVELLDDILLDVKLKFMGSLAPLHLKNLIDKANINWHLVNKPRWKVYGSAWAVGKWARKDVAKQALKLREHKHPTISLNGTIYFLVIQINKGAVKVITRRGLRYLIAHEFAHILQIVADKEVDGTCSYSTETDHDDRWLRITRWMGGTGSEIIPFEEVWI